MVKRMALVAAVATFTTALPAAIEARTLTTTPGTLYHVKVVVDDKGIHIPADRFTVHGLHRYPRGALLQYTFINEGSKPYAVWVWDQDTAALKPHGGKGILLLNWNYRGEFHYYRKLHGKRIAPVGTIDVF